MPHQTSPTYKSMFEAVRQTFENMAFAEVAEQSEELKVETPTDASWVSILINHPIQGELYLALPQTLLKTLAADMFSIDIGEVDKNQCQDIIAELLNTIAGLFMTKLLPDDQTYQLGLPEHGKGPIPKTEEESIVWNLQIDGSPLLLVANGTGFLSLNPEINA